MKKRETELDILRIFALLGVIFTHASGIETADTGVRLSHSFLLAVVTWHVPIYVMLSGRFFLDPERQMPARKLWKAAWRLVIAFVVWDIVYQIHYVLSGAYAGLNWKGIASQALTGPYHFWYLHMLICLYAITPFLRKICQDKKLMEYFLLLFFVFSGLTEYGPDLPYVGSTLSGLITKGNFHFALGYSGYYILGYYLKKYPLSWKKEIGLYGLGIVMLLLTGGATVWNVVRGAAGKEWFSKYLMPNVIIEAAALYTFFVNRVRKAVVGDRIAGLFAKLAEYSFGVYLIHGLVLDCIDRCLPNGFAANRLVIVFAVLIATFAVSVLITALLRKLPYIGKRIT